MRGGVAHVRQHRTRHPQDLQQRVVPLAGVDIEYQRARGIGGVGRVHPAAGQPPQQIRIHRAEQQFAAFGAGARARHMIENPCHLGAGEIRIDDQSGARGDLRFVTLCLELRADVRRAAILPDDGAMYRTAGGAIPHHRGLALIGDADGGDVRRRDVGLLHRLAAGRERGLPDIVGLVFDPARRREVLREFLLGDRGDRGVGAKHDGARRCGALINREDMRRHAALPGCSIKIQGNRIARPRSICGGHASHGTIP